MDLVQILGAALLLLAAAYATIYGAVILLSHSPRSSTRRERQFVSAVGEEPRSLPSLGSSPELDMSVVIPCYNETGRLATMLSECVPVLDKEYGKSWEILLVDDGSKDGTAEYALDWAAQQKLRPSSLRVTVLEKNRGKGGAVTHGMKHTRGRYIIFADADGASNFSDITKLMAKIKGQELGVAIGSRAHMVKTEAVVKRSFIRNFLMYGLHTLLYVFGLRTIGDTQCGFKLFTREAANRIFPYMHTEGWIFDVEVLIIAMKKSIPVHEVPISWHEVEGSKIELARDSIRMAIDLVVMRFAYLLGVYDPHTHTMDANYVGDVSK